jgi:membrane protein DedA with SNARE-associated domain
MEHFTISAIKHFVEAHSIYAYILIFLGVIIEGEVVVIFAGIFSYLGSLNIFISLLSVICGGCTKSFLGYSIGSYLQRHHSRQSFLMKIEKRIMYFLPNFEQRPFWSIFISRFFILGIGWFTLIFSGYKKIPIRMYAKAEGLSLLAWSSGVLAIGYFFSFTALSISRDIRHVLGIILICFISFFILQNFIAFIAEFFELKIDDLKNSEK